MAYSREDPTVTKIRESSTAREAREFERVALSVSDNSARDGDHKRQLKQEPESRLAKWLRRWTS